MEILPVITVSELEDLTMNDELITICQSQPANASKIINQVSIRLWNKIDKEIFYDEERGMYRIPEDLKYACANLCESFYTYSIKEWNNNGTSRKVSERIDDYSITYSDSSSAYTFFGVPTDSDIIAIIEAYSWVTGKGYRNVNLH